MGGQCVLGKFLEIRNPVFRKNTRRCRIRDFYKFYLVQITVYNFFRAYDLKRLTLKQFRKEGCETVPCSEETSMKYFTVLFFTISTFCFAQQSIFHYRTNNSQTFRIRPGTDKTFHYVNMDRKDIVENSLFDIDDTAKKFIIPQNGFYEISALFRFNPSTSNIRYNRGGLNFGIVVISEGVEQYVAATRKSFSKDNQDRFSVVRVYPTIVYLQKDMVVAPAVSAGLIGNVLLGCELGCGRQKSCISFEWKIKQISNEEGHQKYY